LDKQAKSYSQKSVNALAVIFLLTVLLSQIALITALMYSLIPNAQIDWFRTWENWDHAISALEHGATVAALIVGGMFAYYKFFKRRLFVPRLELGLSARSICKDQTSYLVVSLKLKNVGLSRVDIHQKGTALRIRWAENLLVTKTDSVTWKKLRSFSIFERHAWIESGEPIREELMIAAPRCNRLAFRLEFRLIGSLTEPAFKAKRVAWRTVRIIEQTPKAP
jgi:hypothetical protein